jgi:hypothetical protein
VRTWRSPGGSDPQPRSARSALRGTDGLGDTAGPCRELDFDVDNELVDDLHVDLDHKLFHVDLDHKLFHVDLDNEHFHVDDNRATSSASGRSARGATGPSGERWTGSAKCCWRRAGRSAVGERRPDSLLTMG